MKQFADIGNGVALIFQSASFDNQEPEPIVDARVLILVHSPEIEFNVVSSRLGDNNCELSDTDNSALSNRVVMRTVLMNTGMSRIVQRPTSAAPEVNACIPAGSAVFGEKV